MALNPEATAGAKGLGADRAAHDVTEIASDQPATSRRSSPAARPTSTEPIVVPNTLWTSANPIAYNGGRAPEITHLREWAQTEDAGPRQRALGRARGGPDQGRLRPRPDPREQPLAAAVGPGLLRDRDDVGGDQQERHGPLGHVPVPGQPAPGGRADRRRHADDEDGRARSSASGSRCRSRSGASRWATARARAAATSAATPPSRASTGSCPWTSTCRAARRAPRASSTG